MPISLKRPGGWVGSSMLMAASIAIAQSAPDTPTIRQNVHLVAIDVLVTDKDGRAVPGLAAEDFTVTENGVTQKVLHAEAHLAQRSDTNSDAISPEAVGRD